MKSSTETMNENSNGNEIEEKVESRIKILWLNVVYYIILNTMSLYGFYLIFTSTMWKTIIFSIFYMVLGFIGITAGSHRLWSHRSYKAKWPLRAVLCVFASIAAQNSIYKWCHDHRVHHKFTETNADPHSIKRGFFFAHMGWLLCERHPDMMQNAKSIKMDDLWADPIIRFNERYSYPMMIFFSFYLSTMIPVWWWGESLWISFCVAGLTRYCISLHFTWLVNSAAHYYGNQPFDKYIEARENPLVAILAIGEGWHNFHHAFPWDYSTSELGYTFNLTKIFIDFMAAIGLAYDLKEASSEVVVNRKLKSGDGSRLLQNVLESESCKSL